MNRGSEWHRWEPHIHTPGTVLEDRYPPNSWDAYLLALEEADPALEAIGITDYCITRSYERFTKEVQRSGRLPGRLIFPNIELRLDIGTIDGHFVNIHLLVSPEDQNHVEELKRFLGRLRFRAYDDEFACTQDDLVRLGRRADPPMRDDESALRHGVSQFKLNLDNLTEAYRDIEWARRNILIAPAGSSDGTSGLREAADATLRVRIEKAAHAMFASNPKQRDFWLGHGAASANELRANYDGLKPCLWGCDAHALAKVANPDERRLCWIKGLPTFDALRQACIDPERAYVGEWPPTWATSQVIDEIVVESAPWAATPSVTLNPGLVAIIGARGSGKTALVDIIAAGCDAYVESEDRPSFLVRAREHLSGARASVKWQTGGVPTSFPLDGPVSKRSDTYPRARYLSQQFVEDLCSVEGMPELIREVERVIFESHSSLDRDGAADFDELVDLRARQYRDAREREEAALANMSDQIGIEIEKRRQVPGLKKQIVEKEKLLKGYEADRKNLLPKKQDKTAERLQQLLDAAEKVRSQVRILANREASLAGLKNEINDLRQNRAPGELRSLKDLYKSIPLIQTEWDRFLLRYTGDVDSLVTTKSNETERSARALKGTKPTAPIHGDGRFLEPTADLSKTTLGVLEAEIERLQQLLAANKETAKRLAAVSKRITEETTAITALNERLVDCEGAFDRAKALTVEREKGYARVFDAILSEERVLSELYAPLMRRLDAAGGTLAKLSFKVTRVVNVAKWARQGEDDLFDLRTGPFRGIGSLEKIASEMLGSVWKSGTSQDASTAMTAFKNEHQERLLEKAPHPQSDQPKYRAWSRRFAQWLYSTGHISIEYGIEYDKLDIRKLSPGTRGIVLLLLYLALDNEDDRPLIIDQPEENLDPRSIYDELVPLFQAAKQKRQVIMVTHNANLVVNTDADQIIVADAGPRIGAGLPLISYDSGGLDEERIRTSVCDILEGGEQAFRDRARRLRIALAR